MNPQFITLFRMVMSLTIGSLLSTSLLKAECQCNRGGSSAPIYGPAVSQGYMGNDVLMGNVVSSDSFGGSSILGEMSSTNGYPMTADVAPPPGTLGQTYQRPMRPIPVDRHPRIGIVDVRVNGATSVKVYGTNEYRTKDGITGFQDRRDSSIWRFESEPLVPGVSHIYRVVAKFGDTAQERYIRLVPGRIVTLDF